jgi:hypothetical protein
MLELSAAERQSYALVREESRIAIDNAVRKMTVVNEYNIVLQMILQLRLMCNHGTFGWQSSVPAPDSRPPSDLDETTALLQQRGEMICAYCLSDITSLTSTEEGQPSYYLTVCLHLLCPECLQHYESGLKKLKEEGWFQCPLCSQIVGPEYLVEANQIVENQFTGASETNRPTLPYSFQQDGYSSKIDDLVRDLQKIPEGTKS